MKLVHDVFGVIYEVKDKKPIFYSDSLRMTMKKGIKTPLHVTRFLKLKKEVYLKHRKSTKAFSLFYGPYVLNKQDGHYHWED